MTERSLIRQQVQEHFDKVWQVGDAWDLESSEFEQAKYDRQLTLLAGRHYGRTLELGCGSGCFTRRLAGIAGQVMALDVAAGAIERARLQVAAAGPAVVDFRVADIMEYDLHAERPWDLVVLSETIVCLGWLYSFFDVAWLASQLFASTSPGGRLLLVNTYGQEGEDWLQLPWLVNTYRDLFRNVGYRLGHEELFRGTKNSTDLEVLISLFDKADAQLAPSASDGPVAGARG